MVNQFDICKHVTYFDNTRGSELITSLRITARAVIFLNSLSNPVSRGLHCDLQGFNLTRVLGFLKFSAQLLGLQAVEHDEHELTRWVLFTITFLSTVLVREREVRE
jgi:hypothetical protein